MNCFGTVMRLDSSIIKEIMRVYLILHLANAQRYKQQENVKYNRIFLTEYSSALTLYSSALTLDSSALTLYGSALTLYSSALTLYSSALTLYSSV